MTIEKNEVESESKEWEVVPINEFSIPSPPVTQKVKKQVKLIKSILKKEEPENEGSFSQELNLEKLPDWKLDRIAPPIDWESAAKQFDLTIKDWLEDKFPNNHEIIVMIGPPYAGYAEILRTWATENKIECVVPPTVDQIFSSDFSWFENPDTDRIWVYPNLESGLIRHAEGLDLVRDFLDKAYSGALGKGIIGCNSWTWNYLSYIWHGKFPNTFTLQAFDQSKLTNVFNTLSKKASFRNYVFRQSDNGKYIIPINYPEEDKGERSDFLVSLAAYSRGNFGVAYEYWHTSPRLEPDQILDKETEEENASSEMTVWMTPWSDIKKPSVGSGSKVEKAIVLHTLLIHHGLSYDVLKELLPISPNQIRESLHLLEEGEILINNDGKWMVKPVAYPAVREFVQVNDYMIDQF